MAFSCTLGLHEAADFPNQLDSLSLQKGLSGRLRPEGVDVDRRPNIPTQISTFAETIDSNEYLQSRLHRRLIRSIHPGSFERIRGMAKVL